MLRRLSLLLLWILLIGTSLQAQSVVINKLFNSGVTNGVDDAVELIVVQNNLDMRGMVIKDFSGSMGSDGGGKYLFNNNPLWQRLPAGTVIVILVGSSADDDVVPDDYSLRIGLNNTTYFTRDGLTTFDIAGTDFVMIKAAGTGTSGVNGNIHSFGAGTAGSLFNSVQGPKLLASALSGTTRFAVATTPNRALTDFNGNATTTGVADAFTLGTPNNANNSQFIASLRSSGGPRITVSLDSRVIQNNNRFSFLPENANQTYTASLRVGNAGGDTLNFNSITLSGSNTFSLSRTAFNALTANAFDSLVISFTPPDTAQYEATLTLSSNAVNTPVFSIIIEGKVSTIRPIATVRNFPLGTVITVAGRVTDGGRSGSPVYFEDATGGFAAFDNALNVQAEYGDSLIITGPISEFTGGGASGSGLRQISGSGVSFQLFKEDPVFIDPVVVTVSQLTSSDQLQWRLVRINNATVFQSNNNVLNGAFQGNVTYTLRDGGSASIPFRVAGNTNIANAPTPPWPTSVIGVVGRFSNTLQVLPRSASDLGISPFTIPYESIPRSQTFEIVTWNIKWFGVPAQSGYADLNLQIRNVAQVIRTINAEVYALQEISEPGTFNILLDCLATSNYRGFIAPISQQQRTAFLYKRTEIDSIAASFTFTTGDWASGRWPYEFIYDYNFGQSKYRMHAVNVHAKAFGDQDSYNRRVTDFAQLKTWSGSTRPNDALIILGDYNDEIPLSTFNAQPSPFLNFSNDSLNYRVITRFLNERGQTSYSSRSMLDHITITNELFSVHLDSTQRIENTSYIPNYLSTTSDHYPVWTRFRFSTLSSPREASRPDEFVLAQNYPNPFNPSTRIQYQLPYGGNARLEVYDVLGRRVAVLVDGIVAAGRYEAVFNAQSLSSGVYFYRLSLSPSNSANAPVTKTLKMMLMK